MKGAYRMHVRVQPMSENLAMPIDATPKGQGPQAACYQAGGLLQPSSLRPQLLRRRARSGRAGAVRFRPLRK